MSGNLKRTEYLECGYVVLRIILKWILMTLVKVVVYVLHSSALEHETLVGYMKP